jgi:hypothetical protein
MTSAALRAADSYESEEIPTKEQAIAELKALVADLRDAAGDGRMLTQRYAELLTKCVDEYCVEFEQRAERALARLEQAK